jgi:hypothetical protein
VSRRRVLSYDSYAACTYHDIEMEAMQSPFAQLRNLRPIPAGVLTAMWVIAFRNNKPPRQLS